MKVIEIRKDNRTGETVEVSWGNNIVSDFSVIGSVVSIVQGLREQENAKTQTKSVPHMCMGDHKCPRAPAYNPILDRFTTVAIRVEL